MKLFNQEVLRVVLLITATAISRRLKSAEELSIFRYASDLYQARKEIVNTARFHIISLGWPV